MRAPVATFRRTVPSTVGVLAVYFLAAKIGLWIPFTSANVSPVWPASGVGIAAVLALGYEMWPGIAAGAFLSNFFSPIPHTAAAGIAAGNTLSAIIGGWLLRRVPRFGVNLKCLRDVGALALFGASISPIIAASVGVTSLRLAGADPWNGLGEAWLQWWIGDGMGILLVTPPLLLLLSPRAHEHPRKSIELAMLAMLLVGACYAVFRSAFLQNIPSVVILPVALWGAVRLKVAGAAVANTVIAAASVAATARGLGPFLGHTPLRNALLLQVFLGGISLTTLAVGALVGERERARSDLVSEQLFATELRATKDTLAKLAGIVEASEDAIIGLDTSGTIMTWNRGAERLYGFVAEEAIGQPIGIIVPPELASADEDFRSRIGRGERIDHFETVRVRKDGSVVEVSLTVSPIRNTHGQLIGVSKSARDITERKRMEQKLRQTEEHFSLLVSASSEVVYRMSPDWTVMHRLEGKEFIADTSDPSGQWLDKYIPPQDQPHVMAAIHGAIRNKSIFELEHRVWRADGSIGWTHSRAIPLFDSNGEIVEWFGAASDVTGHKQAEEKLQVAAKIAATARLAATIAHEINNPLAAATNYLFLAKMQTDLGTQAGAFVRHADEELARIANIAHQTLGLYYTGTRVPRTVDITKLLDEVLLSLDKRISAKGLAIEREYTGQPEVEWSPEELFQVFGSIVLNAIGASYAQGKIRIRVRTVLWPSSKVPRAVRITISDSGSGIRREHRSMVFEPFFTTKLDVGTGLALWNAKQIVERHGGAIRFRSTARRNVSGTTFSILLPLESLPAAA
jgi:PAS domain S-box-containing protein